MRIPHAAINGSGIGGLEPPPLLYKKNLVPNLHMHVLEKKPIIMLGSDVNMASAFSLMQ